MKLNASPGGGATMTIMHISHCKANPAAGELNGLLEAKKRGKGIIPLRPSS